VREPDRAEELASSVTHAFGLVLSLAGLYPLAVIHGPGAFPTQAAGCVVYGASLVLLYGASTLYHGCRHAGLKRALLAVDHVGIYGLIAGTYTPLALIALRGSRLDWGLLLLIWALALLGSLSKIRRVDRIAEDSFGSYLALAWMALAASSRVAAQAPPGALGWLIAGSVFYTGGLIFFVRCERRFHHAIWHLFVLAGSVCHYRAITSFALLLLS
jgi:hemolysin III